MFLTIDVISCLIVQNDGALYLFTIARPLCRWSWFQRYSVIMGQKKKATNIGHISSKRQNYFVARIANCPIIQKNDLYLDYYYFIPKIISTNDL